MSSDNQSFIASKTGNRRVSTAPYQSLNEIKQFKLSKKFLQLEQTVLFSNQLLHNSFDKFDLDSAQGQYLCQKYLSCIQSLCQTYNVRTANRDYRANFSQAYKVLYKEGELSYLSEIFDSAQERFPFLWVNGQKYSFSQEVLAYGSRLMIQFFKLQHCLRDLHSKVTQQPISITIDMVFNQIKQNIVEFDLSWSTFQRYYILELMNIEVQARSLIAKAIEAQKQLTSVQIRQKIKGKILLNSQDYLSTRGKLCQIISIINKVANNSGKGRDDLDHTILCQSEGVIRRITREQSKAIRILAQKIRNSFNNIRNLLRKYDKNIQMVDPQLKNNSDLVYTLVEYEQSWEKGGNYLCDSEKKKQLLHFSGTIEGIYQKYQKFKQMLDCSDPDIFLIIPSILLLKSLDKDDKNLCKYFLPNLNQIDTKTFGMYFQLQKKYQQWKKQTLEHYSYYNILQKIIVGIQLSINQNSKMNAKKQLVHKVNSKIKNLGMQLHHYNPTQWNSFIQICLAGAIGKQTILIGISTQIFQFNDFIKDYYNYIRFVVKMKGTRPGAKVAAKKKIERPGLTEDEVQELREAFNLFDTQATGKIDPRQLKSAMQSLGFQTKNPTIFNMIADLQSEGRQVDFEQFLDAITSRLGDKQSRAGINKIFELFDDDKTGSVNINNIKRVAKQLGETMNLNQLQEMLQRAASNGRQITKDDFYNIMTKKAF